MSDREFLSGALGDWRNIDDLVAHFGTGPSPPFFPPISDRDNHIILFRGLYPESVKSTIDQADRILRGRISLLGKEFDFSKDLVWHSDPESSFRWPREYFEKFEHRAWSIPGMGDIKYPWELNRHQHFIQLGKAYWLTENERYADEFARQVIMWVDDNPVAFGINWSSSLEIGIRIISWVIAFKFFRNAQSFAGETSRQFLKSLFEQTRFLRNHLTLNKEFVNNHTLGEAVALVIMGAQFPEFRDATEWLRTGMEVLEQQLLLQISSDGVHKEQSTSYHRFVSDFLVLVVILGRSGMISVPNSLEKQLEKMLIYVMHMTMPNGRIPMIGDADDGRGYAFSSDGDFWDFRDLLAMGAVLYGRGDFKLVAQDFGEQAFWLLGEDGVEAFENIDSRPPQEASKSFPEAGQYILRGNWTDSSDYAFFRTGPFGLGGEGFSAHSHCDMLSFILCIDGRPVIIDSGTYSYRGGYRHSFRGTLSHNTLVVDGKEQAIPRDFFRWRNVPIAKCLAWEGNSVAGAMKLSSGTSIQRRLAYLKPGSWRVTDTIHDDGYHDLAWYFHFVPGLSLHGQPGSRSLYVEDGGIRIINISPPIGVDCDLRESLYSERYGILQPRPMLVGSWSGEILQERPKFIWNLIATW